LFSHPRRLSTAAPSSNGNSSAVNMVATSGKGNCPNLSWLAWPTFDVDVAPLFDYRMLVIPIRTGVRCFSSEETG